MQEKYIRDYLLSTLFCIQINILNSLHINGYYFFCYTALSKILLHTNFVSKMQMKYCIQGIHIYTY